jgi:glycolate oxidase
MTATQALTRQTIANQLNGVSAELLAALRAIVGADGVLTAPSDLAVYECDGYTIAKNRPDVVVFPTSTAQVVEIVRVCNRYKVPFLPRGAGTSLSGGCLPVGGGVLICLTRMKRILEINYRDGYAVVEPGVVNLWLTRETSPRGWHFAPDPSSQGACTIGGNVATNSGGPHTLKYGVTVNHVLGSGNCPARRHGGSRGAGRLTICPVTT